LLFSAHSIPQKISDRGDPYKDQIEATVSLIMESFHDFRHTICYQSKVGRLKWLEPSLEKELLATHEREEAALVIPIAFTSEHSETLVELDLDYAAMAKELGLDFCRVPTLSSHPLFIATLADLVLNQLSYTNQTLYNNYYKENASKTCDAKFCCKKISFK
jgi:ferrochelatase